MIDYNLIHQGIEHYSKWKYLRTEVPWLVPQPISNITKPPDASDYIVSSKNKVLIASGEQGFLYQYRKGFLPAGKFQTVTPCFRDEQFDELHLKYFIKLELIDTENVNQKSLLNMIHHEVLPFFISQFKDPKKLEVVKTVSNSDSNPVSFDICYPNSNNELVELGSYGIRHTTFLSWIYGTGIAEPRLSTLMQEVNK